MTPARFIRPCLLLALLPLAGCQTAYYATMEKFGVEKREILVDRVQEARDAQQDTKQQFQSALEQFRSVVSFDAGQLDERYSILKSEFELAEKRASAVGNRIQKVEDVSRALFAEWEKELQQYSNDALRRSSERQLYQTQAAYNQLINAMRTAEAKITPVLNAFRDQVLFLKHNLNAQAIASLKTELNSMEGEIASLIADMEKSIAEADAFIQQMGRL